MKEEFQHPTLDAVKAIHEEVLRAHGGSSGIRDENLLESALAAPRATMMGKPMIEDPIEVAAAYLFVNVPRERAQYFKPWPCVHVHILVNENSVGPR